MAETPHELCPWTPPTLCTVVPSLSLPIWDVGCREAAGHLKVSGAPGSGLRFSPRSLAPGTQVRLCGRTRWGRRWDSVGGVDSVWALGMCQCLLESPGGISILKEPYFSCKLPSGACQNMNKSVTQSALPLNLWVSSEVAQPYLTLWDPMDCSLPGSSVHGIFQARILEWVAISFSRRSS